MKKLKIISEPEESYVRVIWNYHVEIDGERFVLLVDEDSNGSERNIYHYDENQRGGIGEEYEGSDYDDLFEELCEMDLFSRWGQEEGQEFELFYDEQD